MRNIEIIRNFICAWSRLDPNELADFFTDGGSYHNMPTQPIVGKENVKVFIENFLASWTETNWKIINIVEDGEIVYCERIDRIKSTHGDVDLPCFGVFEMEKGKIHIWRDYFDLGMYTEAMS